MLNPGGQDLNSHASSSQNEVSGPAALHHWEPVRNANSQAHPGPSDQKLLQGGRGGGSVQQCVFEQAFRQMYAEFGEPLLYTVLPVLFLYI